MSRGIAVAALAAHWLGLLAAADAGTSDDYVYRAGDATGETSDLVAIDVGLESTGADILSWSVAVCHDTDVVSIVEVDEGDLIDTIRNGLTASFHEVSIYDEGWVAGVIICFTSCAALSPSEDGILYTATYSLDALAPASTAIEFCDATLPAIDNLVVLDGSEEITPTFVDGGIEITGPTPLYFRYATHATSVLYDPVNGLASFDQALTIAEEPDEPGYPNGIEAFTLALGHDPLFLAATGADIGADLSAVNGGLGPEFFSVTLLDEGLFVDALVTTGGGSTALAADGPTEVAVVHYDTNPLALRFNTIGIETELAWNDELPSPATPSIVSVPGYFTGTILEGATVRLIPRERFVRGDIDGDARVGLADPLALLAYLFQDGTIAPCLDAADVNDNGSVGLTDAMYHLAFQFLSGAAPPSPYPECGFDLSGTPRCQIYNECE